MSSGLLNTAGVTRGYDLCQRIHEFAGDGHIDGLGGEDIDRRERVELSARGVARARDDHRFDRIGLDDRTQRERQQGNREGGWYEARHDMRPAVGTRLYTARLLQDYSRAALAVPGIAKNS